MSQISSMLLIHIHLFFCTNFLYKSSLMSQWPTDVLSTLASQSRVHPCQQEKMDKVSQDYKSIPNSTTKVEASRSIYCTRQVTYCIWCPLACDFQLLHSTIVKQYPPAWIHWYDTRCCLTFGCHSLPNTVKHLPSDKGVERPDRWNLIGERAMRVWWKTPWRYLATTWGYPSLGPACAATPSLRETSGVEDPRRLLKSEMVKDEMLDDPNAILPK